MIPIIVSTWRRPGKKIGPKLILAYTLDASQAGSGPPLGVSGVCLWTMTPMSAHLARPGERIAAYSYIHRPPAHLQLPEQANPRPASNIISTEAIASSARDANTAMYAPSVRSPTQSRSVLKAQLERSPRSSENLAHSPVDMTVKQ